MAVNCEWQRHLGVGPTVLRGRVGISASTRSRRYAMRTKVSLATVAAVIVLSACGGSGHRSAASTSAPSVSPTTPIVTPSLPASSTSVSSTVAAVTTSAPSTTLPVDPAVAVRAGLDAGWLAYNRAVLDVERFDPATIRASFANPLRDSVIGNIEVLVSKGWRTRSGPVGGYYVVESVTFTDSTHATVRTCHFDDGVVFDPNAGANEVIVNDEILSTHEDRVMVVEDGVWKNSDVTEIDRRVGVNTCPAKA